MSKYIIKLFFLFVIYYSDISASSIGDFKKSKVDDEINKSNKELIQDTYKYFVKLYAGLLYFDTSMGFYYNKNITFELNYTYQMDILQESSHIYGIGIRSFFTDTVNFRVSLSTRHGVSIEYEASYTASDEIQKTKDYGFDIALGSQWRVKSLLLSVEWAAVYSPLLKRRGGNLDVQFRILGIGIGFIW